MRIVMLAPNDPAGTAYRLMQAVNEYTEHECRLITWERKYNCEYPEDIYIGGKEDGHAALVYDAQALLREADVIHEHMPGVVISPPISIPNNGARCVRHYHGEPWFCRDEARRGPFTRVVSTPNLLWEVPGARWLPNIAPDVTPELFPPRVVPLRVAHSPTNRYRKNTEAIIKACEGLQDIELDLIENVTHAEVLKRKAEAHLIIDQLGPSFGVSTLEAFALGRSSICALGWEQLDIIHRWTGQDWPGFVALTPRQLRSHMERLNDDPEYSCCVLAARGLRAREYVESAWSAERIALAYDCILHGR